MVDELQAEAQARLETSSWSVLDAETLRRYTDADLEARPDVAPVLLRAVRTLPDASTLDKGDGWDVRWKDGVAVVYHLSGRVARTARTRHAMVALLPREPNEVYVECDTAIHGLPNMR